MKNIVLSFALLTSAIFAEEFQAQKYTWNYVVQAKDVESYDSMREFSGKMRSLISEMNQDSVRASSVDIYQKFLLFVKEMQEAIAAGVNLFGSVSTGTEPFVVMVQEAAQAVVQEVIEQAVEQASNDDQEIKSAQSEEQVEAETVAQEVVQENAPVVIPAVAISFQCVIQDESEQENWNAAINLLEALAQKINTNSITSEEMVAEFITVYEVLAKLKGSGLSLSACY